MFWKKNELGLKKNSIKAISMLLVLTLLCTSIVVLPNPLTSISNAATSFTDDFSDNNYDGWTTYGGSWNVTSNTLNVNSGPGYKAIVDSTSFSDVSYEADVKITSDTGDAGILFRVTSATLGGDNVVGYYAGINVNNDSIIFGKMNNNWQELTKRSKTIDKGTTYHMKVVAFGSLIKIFVDDMVTPVISIMDNAYSQGTIGVRIYDAAASFDNVSANSYSAPAIIESFTTAQVVTKANVPPQLPDKVTALYNNGTSQTVDVTTWGSIDVEKYKSPGSFIVEGSVDGTTVKATVNVTVSASRLAPGEATPIANQGSLVKTPFIPLPLGSIKADGWLLEQLLLQKNGATGKAEELYSELGSDSAWLGGGAAASDWERPVYYVKGLVALAYTLGDAELEDKASKWIEWSLKSQKVDGSFGPVTNNDWWPRMPMLYAMKDYYEATGDQRVLTFMTNYFNYQSANINNHTLADWGKARVGDNIDSILWLYNRTKDDNLLTLVDTLKNQGYQHTDIFTNSKFHFDSDFQTNHNVNVSEDIKMPAIYYQRSGSQADKNAFRVGDSNLLKTDGQITGMPSGTESLAGLSSTQGVELCAIVERMQSNEEAQMILGDPYLGDQLEKITFNALPGALSKDIKGHQYYSLPNGVQNVKGGYGYKQDHGNDLLVSPDSGFPCCRYNMHMGWPYYVKNMWAATDDGGIAAMAYGPSNVTTKINNQIVTITETTNYPFEEQMKFTVDITTANSFPLKLRIPEWCESPVVMVNGEAQAGVTAGEYYTINRTWTDNDVVTLSVPMEVKTSTQVGNSVGVERGPLVFSLKIGENWNKISERVAGYGEYEVLPTTPWNYGLVVDANHPDDYITVNKGTMPVNPFIQGTTPITLTAKAKKIPSWGLGPNGKTADEVPFGPIVSNELEELVTLVPFGAENIRVTYFPRIKSTTDNASVIYEAESAEMSKVNIANGATDYLVSVSNGKFAGDINDPTAYVQFNNVNANEAGTYTLEIAYASGWGSYSTHLMTVNGGAIQTVKYSPTDGWGRFGRVHVPITLNKGNNTIRLTKGDNFAQLDFIALLTGADTQVVPVTGITISGQDSASSITADNGTLQMVVNTIPNSATDKSVTWSVENGTGSASISPSGLLTAITDGTVTVKATANDGSNIVSNLYPVTISGQTIIDIVTTSAITVSGHGGESTITTKGGTLQMQKDILPVDATDKSVTWSVENGTGSASISPSGLLTAITDGTVTVKATANDGSNIVSNLYPVTISGQIIIDIVTTSAITVSGQGGVSTITTKGGTLQMQKDVLPVDATDKSVTWSVENGTGSASISPSGLLTAITDGTVTVKATANDGSNIVSNLYPVTISGQTIMDIVTTSAITVSGQGGVSTITTKGGTLQMQKDVLPVDATDKSVTWSVENGTGSASISPSGLLTAITDGTVTVKATARDGSNVVSNTYPVTISGQSDGDGGNYNPPSSNNTPPPAVKPVVTSAEIELKPVLSGITAQAAVNVADLQKAFDVAKTDSEGIKTVTLNVAKVVGSDNYAIEIPKAALSSDTNGNMLKINTPIGTIDAPSNMFKPEEVKGNSIELTIGLADKSAINEDVLKDIGDRPVIELKAAIGGKTVAWSNPEAICKITVDYKPTQEELKNPEHITVWYLDGTGKVVAVPSARYDAATGKVTFTTTHFSKYAVVYVNKTFSDIARYSWAKTAIEVMASKGIVTGTSETTYGPEKHITRADFMMLLVKSLGLSSKVDTNFDDVKEGSYYYNAVAIAKKLGITGGIGDNKFNPTEQISRQDMMVLVVKALKIAGVEMEAGTTSDMAGFVDTSKVAAYASDAVATLINEGIIKGSGNAINPAAKLTRAEAAMIIYKLYNK